MFTLLVKAAGMACLAVLGAVTAAAESSASCNTVEFSLDAHATHVTFSNAPRENDAGEVREFLLSSAQNGPPINGTQEVGEKYTLHGTYCLPPDDTPRKATLQLLVHGAGYEKTMWSGFGVSRKNDYVHYANHKGYATLAVDRLGHGENTYHPDAINIVQGGIHVDLLHNIITSIKSGDLPGVDKFDVVAYVGHSYGSLLGNHLAYQHPNAVDAFVLTGFSGTNEFPMHTLEDLFSASFISPTRFRAMSRSYLASRTPEARTIGFYGGAFDHDLAAKDFIVQDTMTLGELLSPGMFPQANTTYKGAVYVITGDLDRIFCSRGPYTCGGVLENTGADIFPRATYEWHVVPNTGHSLTLHESAQETFARIHDWLAKKVY